MDPNSPAKQRMDALIRTGAGRVIAEYLKERMQAKQQEFLRVNSPDQFKQLQGKCLQLEELIKYIES